MPIPFRTQRIATSVTNRILQIYHGLPPRDVPGMPNAPGPLPQGGELEASMAAPKAPVDAAPEAADAIALSPLTR
jgi:hypothetical protein